MYVRYKEFNYVKKTLDDLIKNSFDLKRKEMPQIKGNLTDDFLYYLDSLNILYQRKKLKILTLKSSQNELDINKIIPLAKELSINGMRKNKPIIVSNDNYVLDGHHRFAAWFVINKSIDVDCVVIDKPIKELINITKRYTKVSYKNLLD